MWSILALLSLTLVNFSNCANILAINPSGSYSHQVAFFPIWKELSLRGHKVTFVTPHPMNDSALTNVTEINMDFIFQAYNPDINFNISQIAEDLDIWSVYKYLEVIYIYISDLQMSESRVQELIRGKGKFDVVLVNLWFSEFLAFGKIYNCPTILFSSYYILTSFHHAMGNPSHPLSHPDMFLPFLPPLTFKERVISVLYILYINYFMTYKELPDRKKLIDKHFNISVTMEDLIKDIDMILVNTHPVLEEVRALGPTVVDIGYQREEASTKPIDKDLKNFMDNAKDGFIYFSLGTNVKSKDISRNLFRTIMDTLKELPYKFLYKYEADDMTEKPDNVKFIKWAPQYHILRHPNIKLFIMQGGFQSMEEAIYSGVPMVVIPFFVDQEHNAKLMESKGIAKIVSRKPLRKQELMEAVTEVFNNASYRETIRYLRDLALDVPMTGLEKAIWWIEYVIRHKGAKHLRNPAADLPLYQYYLLDVVGFLLLVIIGFLTILYLLIKQMLIKNIVNLVVMREKKDQ